MATNNDISSYPQNKKHSVSICKGYKRNISDTPGVNGVDSRNYLEKGEKVADKTPFIDAEKYKISY